MRPAPRFGGGGEGEIYELLTEPGKLVKTFEHPERNHRQEKIQELIANQLPAAHGRFVWPEKLLFDAPGRAGRFIGYLMPRIPGGQILSEFYDPEGWPAPQKLIQVL